MAKANNNGPCPLERPLLPGPTVVPRDPHSVTRATEQATASEMGEGRGYLHQLCLEALPQEYDVTQNEETEIKEFKIELDY